ncbi:MAG: OmpA family protein, partial [Bacteroidota bacterium]
LPKQLRPEPATVLKGRLLGEVVPAEVAIAISSVGEEERPRTITVAADGTYQAIIPQGIDLSLSANAEGFFSESNSIALSGDILEELDYDPSMLTASLEQDETYLKRNEEIQLLQLKLSSLNDNLEAVQQERAAYQEQIAKERAQFEAAGGVLPRISDPELDALAHQYHNYLYNKEEKESFQAETTKVEYLNDTIVPPNETKQAVHDDDELEQLRKRFQAYRDQKTDAEPFVWDQPASYEQVSSIPEPSAQQTIKGVSTNNQAASKGNEQQLKEELAQGFNRNKDRTSAKEDWEKDLEEELVKPLEVVDQKYELIQKDVEAVREELDQKIQQQIEMEQGLGLPTTTTPPLLMDTTYNKITPKQSIEKNIELRPVAVGEVITINTIFFKPNTAEVKTISATEVTRLAAFLQTNPTLIVEIGVHTNGWVSHYQAMKLSNQRAQALVQMLVEKGIASERLQAKGYGKSKPIADNETIEGRRANQRVELTILAR